MLRHSPCRQLRNVSGNLGERATSSWKCYLPPKPEDPTPGVQRRRAFRRGERDVVPMITTNQPHQSHSGEGGIPPPVLWDQQVCDQQSGGADRPQRLPARGAGARCPSRHPRRPRVLQNPKNSGSIAAHIVHDIVRRCQAGERPVTVCNLFTVGFEYSRTAPCIFGFARAEHFSRALHRLASPRG